MDKRSSRIDLRQRLQMGVGHLFNALDERMDYLPFFHFELVQDPLCVKHGAFDTPHVAGRFLDVFRLAASIIPLPQADPIYTALANQLYASLTRHPSGLPWNPALPWMQNVACLHNCREILLGLIALMTWRGDLQAETTAATFCRTLYQILGTKARFDAECLGEQGWCNPYGGILSAPPANTGRMIRPLVQYYRLSNDPVALELANRFVKDNLAALCDAEGHLLASAGPHLHSITGTITGLLEYGLLTHDQAIIERVRKAYDTGMAPWRSSYGWVKEFRYRPELAEILKGNTGYPGYDIPRGEANNTADLIESALLLGSLGLPEYYQDAERMLRNQLLAVQFIWPEWAGKETHLSDTLEIRYDEVVRRALGGFCFGSPNDLISYAKEPHQMNTDLAGGALQALCEAWNAVVTDDGQTLSVNLFFSMANESLDLECPGAGDAPITLNLPNPRHLRIRVPSWASPSQVMVQVNGMDRLSARDLVQNQYLELKNLPSSSEVRLWLPLHEETCSETIMDQRYEVSWVNDTVKAIDPSGRFFPLYQPV
jgi:hypothetical protein